MNSEKTFDADEFLRRVYLEILQIIYLARGVDPQSTAWAPRGIWRSRVQDLWIAVEEEELPADIAGPAFTGLAMIQLSDLWECLIKPKQLNDERWDWARRFCQQWAEAQGMTLAGPDRQANAGAVDVDSRGGSDTKARPVGRRRRARDAAIRALTALYPKGAPGTPWKTILGEVNDWLDKNGEPQVSEATVTRAAEEFK